MIGELVKYPASSGISREDMIEDARSVIAKWQAETDLIRKHFMWSDDKLWCYGFYLWKSRQAAEKAHNEDWQKAVQERTGIAPEISYFDAFMILDNETGMVTVED
tara:strand:- start:1756 stop:2070 length:315 start_codon:yes stop_codon:yes gene_type:complete